jgi:preprotein translocase subunit YajC
MLISHAYAQDATPAVTTAETAVPATPAGIAPPDTQAMLIQNVGMIVLLIVMFYFLLIRPQQKRFKEHKEMLDGLKKGDKVVTAGGLIGKIDSLESGEEAIVDLGSGVKVSVLRSMIQTKMDKTDTAASTVKR